MLSIIVTHAELLLLLPLGFGLSLSPAALTLSLRPLISMLSMALTALRISSVEMVSANAKL